MKKLIKLAIASAIVATNIFAIDCVTNSGVTTTPGVNTACNITPSVYRFKLYKLSLCSSAPAVTNIQLDNTGDDSEALPDGYKLDLSMCDATIFNKPQGELVNASVGSSLPLNNASFKNIDGKTYGHYVVEIDREIAHKVSAQFSTSLYGANNSSGNYCWTKDITTTNSVVEASSPNWWANTNWANWTTDCGSSMGTPGFHTDIVDMPAQVVNDTVRTSLRLLSVDNAYVSHSDGSLNTKLILIYPLDAPIKLELVNSINISVQVTNASDVNIKTGSDNNPHPIFNTGVISFSIEAR